MRRLCSVVLAFEALVIALVTPVLINVENVPVPQAMTMGLGLAAACIVVTGLLRFRWAYWLGHAIQVAALAIGLIATAMLVIGGIFAALWVTAVVLGRRMDATTAR